MATSQRTFSWILSRGARPEDSGVQFEVWAPRARRARVRVLTGAARGDHPLCDVNEIAGCHAGHVEGASAGDDYTFILDDDRSLPDPVSRWQPCGVHGPSRVVDPSGFVWTDEGWCGTALSDAVIYELHVGTFTAGGTFGAVIPRLARLRELGVTAIELMPVAQFPGARNWGYDGVALYAVQNTYGGPNGLKCLVDAAHAVGLGGEGGWITTLRTANQNSAVVCVYNCSDRHQQVPFPATTARAWSLRLSTDAAGYGGEDRIPHKFVSQRDVESPERPIVTMPPWSAAIYRQSA